MFKNVVLPLSTATIAMSFSSSRSEFVASMPRIRRGYTYRSGDPEAKRYIPFLAPLSRVHRPFSFSLNPPREAQSDCIAVSISANTLPIGRAVSRRKPIGARFIHQGQNCRFSRGIRGL